MSITTPGLPVEEIPLVPPDLFKDVTPKLCINCQYMASNRDKDINTYRCFAPENPHSIHLVDGSKVYNLAFCVLLREPVYSNMPDRCGIEGKWYKEKTILNTLCANIVTPVQPPQNSLNRLLKRSNAATISVEDL